MTSDYTERLGSELLGHAAGDERLAAMLSLLDLTSNLIAAADEQTSTRARLGAHSSGS
ncbi:hypothetical protein ACFZCG_25030 [Streptomyces tanashiensis]|uniref:hypothetical protein n=1 Tax=Streptomyces tanashiensis TaxID=67367 RepID=UPI0036E96A11